MPAYFIFDLDVHDPAGMLQYLDECRHADEVWRPLHRPRGQFEVVEGDWQPARVVMLEFPNMDRRNSGMSAKNTRT